MFLRGPSVCLLPHECGDMIGAICLLPHECGDILGVLGDFDVYYNTSQPEFKS